MPRIRIPEKLVPILTTSKRIKVAIGGRGGGKSICFADAFLGYCDSGERLCCAREFQNSIDDSVHALLKARNDELEAGLSATANTMTSERGGEIFYKGLARNTESLKSMFGVKRMWIEEAQTLSQKTIDLLEPTIRESNSELWFSANRGASNDPFSIAFLKPYESELERHGRYEDDDVLIIQINYDENPFFPLVLEKTRRRDKKNLSTAKYDHIWNGKYSDTVEDAIIDPEWFDACVDAHKNLGFEPVGAEVFAYDPADTGDAKAYAYTVGSVVKKCAQTKAGMIDTATDWALSEANNLKPDVFRWDCDGIGAGLKRQVEDALGGKKIQLEPFKASGSVENPDLKYQPLDGEIKDAKTNKETFTNLRAQMYWRLRDRIYNTYLAIKKHKYINPDDLISFDSEMGEENITQLRAELGRIPRKYVPSGKIQLMSKKEMKAQEIESPNMADAVMQTMKEVKAAKAVAPPPQPTGHWMSA